MKYPGHGQLDDTVVMARKAATMARAARRLRRFRGIVDRVGIDVPGHRPLDDTVVMARKAATIARAAATAAAIPRNRRPGRH